MPTKKEFHPGVEKDGKVNKTPVDSVLYLKKNARVVLVHNIDVSDGLNNGAKGKVLDFIKDEEGKIIQVVVEFDHSESGASLRQKQTNKFREQYPQGTPISRLHFYYTLGRKQAVEGQKALCIQFPLRLGYAMTIHKVQGVTIELGNSITSCFKDILAVLKHIQY